MSINSWWMLDYCIKLSLFSNKKNTALATVKDLFAVVNCRLP